MLCQLLSATSATMSPWLTRLIERGTAKIKQLQRKEKDMENKHKIILCLVFLLSSVQPLGAFSVHNVQLFH